MAMKARLSKEYKLIHKVLLLIAVPLVFQYLFVGVLAYLLQQSEHEVMRERHAHEVIAEANSVLNAFMHVGTLIYLYQSSDRAVFRDQLQERFQSIPEQLANLRLMVRESPQFARDRKTMEQLADDGLYVINETQAIVAKHNRNMGLNSPILGLVSRLNGFLHEMRKFVQDQKHLELAESERGTAARMRVIVWLLGGLVLNTGLAIYLARAFYKDVWRRLSLLIQNTQLFKANKELNPLVSGTDEIALLDSSFHTMASDLKEISEKKRELQAMVTHDLRTPLTSIRLSLSLMLETMLQDLPPRAEKIVKTAERNCSRLIRLINDLLDIEKLDSGQFVLNKAPLHLALLFESVEDATAEFAATNSIEVVVSEANCKIDADGDRLVQVMVNLVSNAVKFSEKGKKVYIDAVEKGEFVELRIKDEGRGIPKEAIPKLFDRFHQVSASDGARGKGTGLGLSISKALIEAHNGTIEVESEVGVGTTFILRLPMSSEAPEIAAES